MFNFLKYLNFRDKIIVVFLTAILVIVLAASFALPSIKATVINSAKKELVATTNMAGLLVDALYDNAIRNYMRGIAETHLNTMNHYYSQYKQGKFSKEELKKLVEDVFLSHKVGKTGYVVVTDIAKGRENITAAIHPFVKGKRVEKFEFIQKMYTQKEGYFENEWKNPNDSLVRLKAGYMSYFEPWKWIISVNPYKDEFMSLMNIEEFKKSLAKVQPTTLEGSYITVFNGKGELIYHPSFKNYNALESQDAKTGAFFIKEIVDSINERKDDKNISGWKEYTFNQRGMENEVVDKLMNYQYLHKKDWIVATIINKEEILKPYTDLLYKLIIVGIILLFTMIILALISGKYLTDRIQKLVNAAKNLSKQNYNLKLEKIAEDEVGDLEEAFINASKTISSLILKQKQLNVNLEQKVQERTKELAGKNMELEKLYITDSLTRLYNRHKLDEVLTSETNRSNRYQNSFGIILLDIDYFKNVNDTYGHQMGDTTLKEFAEILKKHSRKTDTIGRWGGEEFMIICSETNLEGLVSFATNLQEYISSYGFSIKEQKTASFGVTIYNKGENISSMIKRVDKALYKAKENGRNRVESL